VALAESTSLASAWVIQWFNRRQGHRPKSIIYQRKVDDVEGTKRSKLLQLIEDTGQSRSGDGFGTPDSYVHIRAAHGRPDRLGPEKEDSILRGVQVFLDRREDARTQFRSG
jgi:hypothetical protein